MYSNAEVKMFTELGFGKFLSYTQEYDMYKIASIHCFIHNKTGPAVEVLRKGMYMIQMCTCYRLTPEFDEAISY